MNFLKIIMQFFGRIFLFTGKFGGKTQFDKRLSKEDEKKYFERLKIAKANHDTDPQAEEILIKHNLRLVAHISAKYRSSYSEQDDLISVGSIGLIKAVRNFDPEKASSFSSFASRCIENEILMLLRSEKKLNAETSIDSSIGTDKDGNDLTLADILADPSQDLVTIADRNQRLKKIETLANALLDEREKEIFAFRFGLFSYPTLTQQQIADRLNISRSYISRIEKTAIEKIRTQM